MLRWLLAVVLVLPLAMRTGRVLAGDDPAAPSAGTPPANAESADKSPARRQSTSRVTWALWAGS